MREKNSKMADCWHPSSPEVINHLEKEDQRTPKGTHKIPLPARRKAASESTNREATNHGKNNF
jgi:BRCT domain type II-containing protein